MGDLGSLLRIMATAGGLVLFVGLELLLGVHAAIRRILPVNRSRSQRQHVVVHEGLQALARVDMRELGFCNFDQRLKEVLEVHISLVTVHGAEYQIQSLFHLFVRRVHVG